VPLKRNWRRLLVILAAVAIAAAVRAGDVWKDKPYTEWTEKDIHKILYDSPWAKTASASTDDERELNADMPRAAGGGESDDDDDEKEGHGKRADEDEGRGHDAGTVFVVRWASSRVVRQATVRAAVIEGRVSAAAAEKILAQPAEDISIVVAGADMAAFAGMSDAALASGAELKLKSAKQKRAAVRAEIHRSPDGAKITAVVFHFSRTTPSGEPAVPASEKGVRFVCRANKKVIEGEFEPHKMADKQGMDI